MANRKALRRWRHAQAEELNCWTEIRHKLQSAEYIEKKKEYWRRVLRKAGLSLDKLHEKRILEVGCGPSGIFLLLEPSSNILLLDPLMNDYKRLAPDLVRSHRSVSEPLESADLCDRFDVVFAVNCIDHCSDIRLFLERLAAVTAARGTVVLAVNTHLREWTEFVWQKAQRFMEPHHPYHFTADGYSRLLKPLFEIQQVIDMEEDVLWINRETRVIDGVQHVRERSPLVLLANKLRGGEIVGSLFIRILALFGLPPHDLRGVGRSIYRHKMFLLRPRDPN